MSKLHVGIGFALGLVTGAGATYLLLKKRMDNQLEKDTASIKKVYRDEVDRLKKIQKDSRTEAEKLSERYQEAMATSELSRKPYVKNSGPTPYHQMAEHPTEEDFDQNGQPYDPDGTSINEGYIHDDIPEEFADQYVGPRPDNNRVFLIDEDRYAGDPQYEKLQVTYYEIDGVWADEQEEILQLSDFLSDNVDLAGDILKLLATEDAVYVRNNAIQADYEVVSLETSYADTVYGR